MSVVRKAALLLTVLFWAQAAAGAQTSCPALVETAMRATNDACGAAGRNQACYGHFDITAATQPDAPPLAFAQAGDVVDVAALQSVELSPLDTQLGRWGVALFRIQANLPGTLPGQNVTMLAFGDTVLTAAEPPGTLDGAIQAETNVYLAPNTISAVLGSLPSGTAVRVMGRTEAGDWLLVDFRDGGLSGWTEAAYTQLAGDAAGLPVVEGGSPAPASPLQAFYLRTGTGQPECAEAPPDGILVQTPAGAGSVTLNINRVDVAFGSTLFFRAQPGGQMVMSVLEGAASVTANGESRPAVEGGRVRLDIDDALQPVGSPSPYEPYDEALLAPLPVQYLDRPVGIAPSVSQEEADLVMAHQGFFDQIDVTDFPALLDFLRANPEASNADIGAFLVSLGYEF